MRRIKKKRIKKKEDYVEMIKNVKLDMIKQSHELSTCPNCNMMIVDNHCPYCAGEKSIILEDQSSQLEPCPHCNEPHIIGVSQCPKCHMSLIPIKELETQNEEQIDRYIPKKVQREVWRRDMGRCVECGSKERLEFDHIIPVSKRGSNTTRNIQLLCERCNRKKSNRIGG